jgi:hypothetical protein
MVYSDGTANSCVRHRDRVPIAPAERTDESHPLLPVCSVQGMAHVGGVVVDKSSELLHQAGDAVRPMRPCAGGHMCAWSSSMRSR